MELRKIIKSIVFNNIYLYKAFYRLRYNLPVYILGDEYITRRKYKKVFDKELDLINPKTLTEKIQWLKLNVHENFHTICADKYAAREIWKKYGDDGLIPVAFITDRWEELKKENIPQYPCIVKCNSGSGEYQIIRNREKVDYKDLQKKCRRWMAGNFYYASQEWQYKNIKPCIIVEKLLMDKNGKIPNDYKLHCINGKVEFVYCSVDREGKNYRSIYSPDWKRLNIEWVAVEDHKGYFGADIECPKSFNRMLEIAEDIAKNFAYVRVDFYDIEGQLYYGEITLHHGSGFDTFEPSSYDMYYGGKLDLGKYKND